MHNQNRRDGPCRGLSGGRETGKLLVVGVGDETSGDDAAGYLVVHELERLKAASCTGRLEIVFTGSSPENYTGAIRKSGPSKIIIVDSGDFGGKPGEVTDVSPEHAGNINFSTHGVPLGMLAGFIAETTGAKVMIKLIQKKDNSRGAAPSPEVARSAMKLAAAIHDSLTGVD
jgi:hydrogenase 3 maturation protease